MTVPATTTTDPRSRTDGLGWVARAVFPDERVVLTLDDPPAGHRVVARYAVVPSVDRARFLLPLGAPRAMAAALLSYNALRPPKVRAVRAALGALARAGAVRRLPFPTLTVALPDGVAPADALITAQVTEALGGAPAYAALGVRPPDPNHKPTLQLFDADGTPRGYAKLGWNDATRALVAAEADALRQLPALAGVPDHPLAPGLLAEVDVAQRRVAVVDPLPADIRGVPVGAPPELDALLAVARRGRPAAPARPLAGSSFLTRLAAEAARAAAVEPAGARAVAAVDALAARHGATELEFGHWHGDWVPWNLGRHAGRLVAWDWEHSAPDVPVGFDLAHDAFQRSVVLAGDPVATAARAVDEQLDRYGDRLGLGPARRRAVADAYLLEMWLRTWRLAAAGAGWNPALHPGLLDLMEER
ncbi:hypothetical protein [Micromonospora auratinigra]|uniref:Phosphotransferase enzyme family protein n=1 Tax=Micromonospora auratinigra TaxID=261654 RepID=A0A1A8Z3C3_9ACTN|nr:hypothetical protein [Micromonospora auratinigra]SBT38337.1 hypothetical protein GA0070611_0513 [Micromonospora auratinigra]